MPKLNICVVGLAKNLTDECCFNLASQLELYYANVEKILEFELFDHKNIEKVCGKDYLLKEERSIIKRLCSYENTLINLNYFNLNNDEILNIVKEHCLLIYLHIDEKRFNSICASDYDNNVFDISLFADRDKICLQQADIVIDCKDLENEAICKETILKIINYYS